MNSLEIKTADLTDIQSLIEVERNCFDYDLITLKQMRYLLKSKSAIVVKAVLNDRLIGYMVMLTRKNSRILRIYSIGLVPEEQRLGFGRQLLRYAEKYGVERGLTRIHLELHVENKAALIFYLSEGYCLYGRKENYYTDGAQALLLRKQTLPGLMT